MKTGKSSLLVRTKKGMVCVNAGVDKSNVGKDEYCLLPTDPDSSAWVLSKVLNTPVVITDTQSRFYRRGLVNVAIGCFGLNPLKSYVGTTDPSGYQLNSSVIAVADELAAAAELVMGKVNQVPVAVIRGYFYEPGAAGVGADRIYDTRPEMTIKLREEQLNGSR